MFYVRHLPTELLRRRTRTLITLIGLGDGVALVVFVSHLSHDRGVVLSGVAAAVAFLLAVLLAFSSAGKRVRAPRTVIDAFGPTLAAGASTGGGTSLFGLGAGSARTATSTVSLSAPVGVAVLAIGFGLALLGGLIAGTAGAIRAVWLRPADPLSEMRTGSRRALSPNLRSLTSVS